MDKHERGWLFVVLGWLIASSVKDRVAAGEWWQVVMLLGADCACAVLAVRAFIGAARE